MPEATLTRVARIVARVKAILGLKPGMAQLIEDALAPKLMSVAAASPLSRVGLWKIVRSVCKRVLGVRLGLCGGGGGAVAKWRCVALAPVGEGRGSSPLRHTQGG